MNTRSVTCFIGVACAVVLNAFSAMAEQPNLLIIHTDEHNFRTLGCYREQLPEDQAYVWGEGVKVDTPNIDSIAHDGAICTSFYAASPVCTPSRASFQTGLYPVAAGAPVNDMPMHDNIVTFAEVLKRNGYSTTYLGKWHLDGDAKPGFAPERHFGWEDNRYMFNRGHWKLLEDTPNGPRTGMVKGKPSYAPIGDEKTYTTDFLTDHALEILARDKNKPFCLMLALPDPHGPNTVRAPYDTMYTNFVFKNPRTMDVDEGVMPKWVSLNGKNFKATLKQMQAQMARYFGMVKCIDDNVGRILKYLKDTGLDQNTIVVFTSDHGDLMGEHKHVNKGLPYETSACIPFVIRYPGKIQPGKVIDTAYVNADFAPTILALMGAKGPFPAFHGSDVSVDFLGPEKRVSSDRIVYFTNAGSRWVAAVNHRYKLVLSPNDDPWLFDLKKDPDEIANFYNNPEYKELAAKFEAELVAQMKTYNEPALKKEKLVYETGGAGSNQAEPALASSQDYVVDTGGQSARGRIGQWSRAITVPSTTFEPNSIYALEVEWESKGLDEGAEFFANFIDPKNKKAKQTEFWKGAAGETGVVRKTLKTTNTTGWTLYVGVRDGGEIVIKHLRIKRIKGPVEPGRGIE